MSTSLAYIVGMIANILFGIKSVPQIIKCYKLKSTKDISLGMLLLDFGGNIGCTYYIYSTVGFEVIFQFVNYALATLFLIILFIMMIAYRDTKNESK